MLRRPPLNLEQLGARVLPSITPVTPPPEPLIPLIGGTLIPAARDSSAQPPLDGKGHGNYSASKVMSDAGTDYHLHGSANLTPLGQVSVRGSVHSVGFIAEGHAEGRLTFRNSHGSVTIAVEGPLQKAFSPLPHRFRYHIVSASGDYSGMTGHGTLGLVLTPGSSSQQGTFKISL